MSRTFITEPVPVPLRYYTQALTRAAELRRRGTHWSWPVIADVMRLDHGWDRNPKWWSLQVGCLDRSLQRPRPNAYKARS